MSVQTTVGPNHEMSLILRIQERGHGCVHVRSGGIEQRHASGAIDAQQQWQFGPREANYGLRFQRCIP